MARAGGAGDARKVTPRSGGRLSIRHRAGARTPDGVVELTHPCGVFFCGWQIGI